MFLLFRNIVLKRKIVKNISGLGRYVLGAYLLSDHKVIRKPLWEIVNVKEMIGKGVFVQLLYALGVALCIFLLGCLVEFMRVKLMELINVDNLLKKIDMKFNSIID